MLDAKYAYHVLQKIAILVLILYYCLTAKQAVRLNDKGVV